MATCKSTEITGSPFAEELDVLTAIYSDDIKIVTSSSSACSTPTSAQECSEASQCLPLTLEVRINKEAFVHFHIQDGYPFVKPEIELRAENRNSNAIKEELKTLLKRKDENYLYEAIELARSWFSETSERADKIGKEDAIPVNICKFFKEGKCRFGEKCFNEHPTGKVVSTTVATNTKNSLEYGKKETVRKEKLPEKSASSDDSTKCIGKKQPMKTATDVISRIQWDDDLPTDEFVVGYLDRFVGIVEKSFNSFSWEDIASVDYSTLAVPKHRIQYFKYRDTVVWDKRNRLDKVFGSTGNAKEIYDIIKKDKNQQKAKRAEDKKQICNDSFNDYGNDASSSEDENDCDFDNNINHQPKMGNQKDRPNFFFCFKVTNGLIKEKIIDIQQEIISCNNLLEEGCLKESEFHVTLCMVRLNTDEERQKAIKVLETMQQILVCMLPTLHPLHFLKLGNFRGRVLHIEVLPDPILNKFVNILLLKLKDAGLNPCGNREPYFPHVTILKLSRPMCRALPFKMIDANYYQHHIGDRFGTQAIEEIYLCSTSKQRNQEGFYVDIGSQANSLLCLSDRLPNTVAKNVNRLVKDSILTEAEGDQLQQALFSGDERQFEVTVRQLNEMLTRKRPKQQETGTVVILRGLQGSGKSHMARHFAGNPQAIADATLFKSDGELIGDKKNSMICSADDYFENKGCEYSFNPSELADAHMHCRIKFIEAIDNNVETIIVDNTNSKKWEYQIYERIAKLCGYSTYVVEIACKDEDTIGKFINRSQHKVDKEATYRAWNQWEADDKAVVIDPRFEHEANDISLCDIVKSNEHPKMSVKEVLFSGLFLDDASKTKLLKEYPPLHSKCTANHMTYCYKPMREEVRHIDVGKEVSLSVIAYVCTDLLQVVAVKEKEDVLCRLEVPHVTISHSKKAAPQHAKLALQNKSIWQSPVHEIVLTGKIGVQVSVDQKNSVCITDPILFNDVCKQLMNEERYIDRKVVDRKTSEAGPDTKIGEMPKLKLNMEDIESLYVFDFDGTLFRTPDPVIGRKQYLEITGEKWPHSGWIGKPESLQWPLQTLPGPSFVDFKEHLGRAGSLTVLLTGRLQRTLAGVKEVLREFGVHPERCFLKPDDADDVGRSMVNVHAFKKDVIRGLLKENPKIKSVKIWDDRQDNIDALKRLRKEYKNIDFELFKVDCKESDRLENSAHFEWNSAGFGRRLSKMADELGFGCTPSFDAAVKEGIDFLEDAWLSCLGTSNDPECSIVHQFGSYPLKRIGDVDLFMLAPTSLCPDECIVKLEAELSKRGVRYIHTATGIRCPRMKLRLHFANAAPVDFDLIFAACLDKDNKNPADFLKVFENGDKSVKSAVEGLVFLEKVKSCIEGKMSMERFGRLVDIVVYFLKTKHLKGNAFHCFRTFHLVRALAEMISKLKENFQGMGDLVRKSFEYLATLNSQYWQRICKDTVPEEIVDMTIESFVSAVKLINQPKPCASLFAPVKFPPNNHAICSVKVTSHVKDLQWRAGVIVEAKLGTCIRKLITSGVNVVPGSSDYDNIFLFAIPADETSVRLCQNFLASLKTESIFLINKTDLALKIQIGN